MPFYEYECPACKYYLEVLQKISDKPLKKCPSCGKAGFKRLMSAPVFRLKGSGWYETDFKSDKEGQRNLAGPEREETVTPAAETKLKADDKGDVKPAAETATPQGSKDKADKDKGDKGKGGKDKGQGGGSTASKPGGKAVRRSKPAAKSAAKRALKRPTRAVTRGRGRR